MGTLNPEVAYAMVRHWKPQRIVEIGSGYSTRIMAAALAANLEKDGVAGELITVDPHPERLPNNGWGDLVTVVEAPVQSVELELFDLLASDDILFIDSSHVVSVSARARRLLSRLETQLPEHAGRKTALSAHLGRRSRVALKFLDASITALRKQANGQEQLRRKIGLPPDRSRIFNIRVHNAVENRETGKLSSCKKK